MWHHGYAHGSTLVEYLGSPGPDMDHGMPDNVHAADELLRHAYGEGWFHRGPHPTPTKQQRFFGIGGLWFSGPREEGYIGRYHPCIWGYSPNYGNTVLRTWIFGEIECDN